MQSLIIKLHLLMHCNIKNNYYNSMQVKNYARMVIEIKLKHKSDCTKVIYYLDIYYQY